MQRPTRSGRASDCPPRRNLNTPRAAVSTGNRLSGARKWFRMANGWPIYGKAGFQRRIRRATDLLELPPSPRFRPMVMDFMTWREMFGNGAPLGIGPITTNTAPAKVRRDPRTALTPTNQDWPSECFAAVSYTHLT